MTLLSPNFINKSHLFNGESLNKFQNYKLKKLICASFKDKGYIFQKSKINFLYIE